MSIGYLAYLWAWGAGNRLEVCRHLVLIDVRRETWDVEDYAPASNPTAAAQGAIWIMFREIIASNGA